MYDSMDAITLVEIRDKIAELDELIDQQEERQHCAFEQTLRSRQRWEDLIERVMSGELITARPS